jgi:hypothetical protein
LVVIPAGDLFLSFNSTDIPKRRFEVPLAIKRRKQGWTPGKAAQKKAS